MKKLKIYLDTSIINFLFADDTPDFKRNTEDFFDNYLKKGIYDCLVSDVVFDEINRTEEDEKRLKLLQVIKDYNIPYDSFNKEAERLAHIYIKDGVIPVKKFDDARHIGLATTNSFDILLSWNFKHLANVNKRIKIKIINEREGYFYPLDLVTPIQLIYDEND
jgi:hypothetical protein